MYRPFHTSWSSEPYQEPAPPALLAAPAPAAPVAPLPSPAPLATPAPQTPELFVDRHERPVSITDQLQAMSSVESISDARSMLIRMLQDTLRGRIHTTLTELYEDAQRLAHGQEVKAFQELLKEVEHWNARILEAEAAEIRQMRPDLDEVITGAFVATFMVLASVRGQNDDEVRVRVPSAEAFIHDCYILVGREMFSAPFLYTEAEPSLYIDYRNRALQIIDRCVEAAVLQRISVQQVMRFPGSVPPPAPSYAAQQLQPLHPPHAPQQPPQPYAAQQAQAPTRANVESVAPEDSVSQRSRQRSSHPHSDRSRHERRSRSRERDHERDHDRDHRSSHARSIQLRSTAAARRSSPSRRSESSLEPQLRHSSHGSRR